MFKLPWYVAAADRIRNEQLIAACRPHRISYCYVVHRRRKSSLQSSLSGELSSSGLDQASAGELAAFGALLGVCIGDAAGAPLEYPRCSWVPDERVSGKVCTVLSSSCLYIPWP